MAALESYSPCPCGSGQKYKWCCQKAEAYAHKSARLLDSGAVEPSKAALEEGLAKFPDNPWLLIRKALILARSHKTAEAAEVLRKLLAKEPGHPAAQSFLVRAILETEDVTTASAQLQTALSVVAPEFRGSLAASAQVVGLIFSEQGHVPAALAHFWLADLLADENDELPYPNSAKTLEANPGVSPWVRNPYHLLSAPDVLPAQQADTFHNAYHMAAEGRWSSAADLFETLAAAGVSAAARNAGLCRLSLAEDEPAVESLRQYIASVGDSTDAVDFEALCQIIAPAKARELVGHVQLIWTLRNRDGLLERLQADPTVSANGRGPIDPEDPDSPEVDWFILLDREAPLDVAAISSIDLPVVDARVLVGTDIAALDLIDDGRMERLRDRLIDLAGPTLPPAHPRTKSLGPVSREHLALNPEVWLPAGLDNAQISRIRDELHERVVTTVWPHTPLPFLDGRTPRQAAADGNAAIALRAALLQFEHVQGLATRAADYSALRTELKLPPEPIIDPETVDIGALHLARLSYVPVEKLSDEKLVQYFFLARRYVLAIAMERASRELTTRPQVLEQTGVDRILPFADLAHLELARGGSREKVFAWLEQGRSGDKSPVNTVRWDFLELRLRVRFEKPEEWVPQLAILLERYGENRETTTVAMTNLLEMGLMELVPNPEDPSQMQIDTRRLQLVLSKFGPKITTASGRLGVSATQGGLWTPGGESSSGGGGGGIWTPGSAKASGAGSDKPKLIIPGR